jgi:SAM-dependent methyltransferase
VSKAYDRAYFDRWYRGAARGVEGPSALRRRVALAVAAAEFALQRPLRSVLDVGCGEGAWHAPLRALRPRLHYLGLDSSEYAVARFGARRNLAFARFGDLEQLRPGPPVDLLVCADVLHYVPDAELRRGLSGFAELCAGVAWVEAYCRGDHIEGDTEGFIARPASRYRALLEAQGFRAYGPYLWLSPALIHQRTGLERLDRG